MGATAVYWLLDTGREVGRRQRERQKCSMDVAVLIYGGGTVHCLEAYVSKISLGNPVI